MNNNIAKNGIAYEVRVSGFHKDLVALWFTDTETDADNYVLHNGKIKLFDDLTGLLTKWLLDQYGIQKIEKSELELNPFGLLKSWYEISFHNEVSEKNVELLKETACFILYSKDFYQQINPEFQLENRLKVFIDHSIDDLSLEYTNSKQNIELIVNSVTNYIIQFVTYLHFPN